MKYVLTAILMAISLCASAQLSIEDSGFWYEPDDPGHGLSIATWPDSLGLPAGGQLFYYGYDLDGNQRWFISGNFSEGVDTVQIYEPSGLFPSNFFEIGEPVGEVTVNRLGSDSLDVLRFTIVIDNDPQGCTGRPQSISVPVCFGEFVFQRLTPRG